MSKIKVNSLEGVGATTPAISIDNTSGSCAANITSLNGGQFSNRNVIINGACQVAQRSNLLTAQAGYGAVDRFSVVSGGASRFTLSKGDGPGAQYGLPSALKFETTTADNSLLATDYMYLDTRLEGQDMQRFQKGTSDAKQYTLQFWIKLAIQGTYVVQLFDVDNSRHVVANYTVSSPNTWEKKIITFPADTSGALDNDNAKSFEVRWHFMGGSNYRSGTQQTTWGSIVAGNMLAGMGNAVSATGDNFITGMQLEVGSVATDFEHRSYAQELQLCKRYFFMIGKDSNRNNNRMSFPFINEAPSNTGGYIDFRFHPEMRTTPTATIGAELVLGRPQVDMGSYHVSSFNEMGAAGCHFFQWSGGQTGSTGDSNKYLRCGHHNDGFAEFSAEL